MLHPSHTNCGPFEREMSLWKRHLNNKRRWKLERVALKTLGLWFSQKKIQPSCLWAASINCPMLAHSGSPFSETPSILGHSHACKWQRQLLQLPWHREAPNVWRSSCPTHSTVLAALSRWPLSQQQRCQKSTMLSISNAQTFTVQKWPKVQNFESCTQCSYLSRLFGSLAWMFCLDWCLNQGFRM